VARRLSEIGRFRGLPLTIRTDQGPEFTGNARESMGNPARRADPINPAW